MLSKKKLFRILSIYTMVILFLPIVKNNIPNPLSLITGTILLLGVFWLLLIFVYHQRILFSKYMITIYIFFFIMYMGSLTFWNEIIYSSEISIKWIILELFGPFLSIIMYLHFIRSKDYKGLALTSIIALFFIFITSISSIIGLNNHPEAVRELTSGTAGKNDALYGKIGIANYTYWVSLVYLFPILTYFLKSSDFNYGKKRLVITFLLFVLFSLVRAQITTALVLALIFMTYSFVIQKGVKSSGILLISIGFLSLFQLNQFIAEIFYFFSNNVSSELLQSRLNDVGKVFELQDFNSESGETYFAQSRLTRISTSFQSFLTNPIIGGGKNGGHSTWIDKLGIFGLLGTIPWVLIFYQQIKLNLSIFDDSYKSFYILSIISILILGILTTTANSVHSSIIIFFIVPGLFYTKFLFNRIGTIKS
jgi:hypothetical protein